MNNTNQKFPNPAPERRLRNKSRNDYSDRRSTQRYLADFPAQIFVGHGKDAKSYEAIIHDISSGGLLIEAPVFHWTRSA